MHFQMSVDICSHVNIYIKEARSRFIAKFKFIKEMSNMKHSNKPNKADNDWFKKRKDNPRGLAFRGQQKLQGRGGKASKTKFQWNKNKETKGKECTSH